MTGLLLPLPLAEDEPAIEIGHHVTREWNGWTFNIDTIVSTLVAAGLVLLLGLLVRAPPHPRARQLRARPSSS